MSIGPKLFLGIFGSLFMHSEGIAETYSINVGLNYQNSSDPKLDHCLTKISEKGRTPLLLQI